MSNQPKSSRTVPGILALLVIVPLAAYVGGYAWMARPMTVELSFRVPPGGSTTYTTVSYQWGRSGTGSELDNQGFWGTVFAPLHQNRPQAAEGHVGAGLSFFLYPAAHSGAFR